MDRGDRQSATQTAMRKTCLKANLLQISNLETCPEKILTCPALSECGQVGVKCSRKRFVETLFSRLSFEGLHLTIA
jgi:hypothetical protein